MLLILLKFTSNENPASYPCYPVISSHKNLTEENYIRSSLSQVWMWLTCVLVVFKCPWLKIC